MEPPANRKPLPEQLVTVNDLTQALVMAERAGCLHASDALNTFIQEECAGVTHTLVGAGIPSTLALDVTRRMARASRASALAVAAAFWREVLPSTPLTPPPRR